MILLGASYSVEGHMCLTWLSRIFKILFIYLSVCMYMHVCTHMCTHLKAQVEVRGQTLKEFVLSFYRTGAGLMMSCYPRKHLASA